MCEPHLSVYNVAPDRKVEPGDLAFVDFGAGYAGYCSDIARMVAVGSANDKMKRIYDVLRGAHRVIKEAIKPGVRACDIFKIGVRYLENDGLCPSLSLVGHGIGLTQHELPFLTPHDTTLIQPGMVISIEPGTELPGLTPLFLEDGGVVTEEGWQSFTSLPEEIHETIG